MAEELIEGAEATTDVVAPEEGANKQEESNTLMTGGKTETVANDKVIDGKPDDGLSVDDKGTPDKTETDKDKAEAPESYADFVMPEGFKLEGEVQTEFSELMKGLNLPQEKAQSVIDLSVKHTQGIMASSEKAFADLRTDWVKSAKANKEFGGEKLNDTLVRSNRALTKFGSPELKAFLNQGYGDNPDLLHAFARIDRATSEDDAVVLGQPPKGSAKSTAEVMYPNQN